MPNNYFKVFDYIKNENNLLMVTFTYENTFKNLKLVIKNDKNNLYLLDINKNKFITNPYIIYNDSNYNVKFVLLFFSKPYWFY